MLLGSMERKISLKLVNVLTEAIVQMFSVKKVFLEISQNSQENNCARIPFLVKLRACKVIKKGYCL